MARAVGATLAAVLSILMGPSDLGGGPSSGNVIGAEGFDGFDLAFWGDSLSWGGEDFWPVEPEEEVNLDGSSTVKITFGPKASEAQTDPPAAEASTEEELPESTKPTADAEGEEPDAAEPNSSWSFFG
jgi:hypothetical protein